MIDPESNRILRLLMMGQIDPAISELQQILNGDPTDGRAWFLLGVAYEDGGNLATAAEAFAASTRAVRQHPGPSQPSELECDLRSHLTRTQDRTSDPSVRIAAARHAASIVQAGEFVRPSAPEWERFWDHLRCLAIAPLDHFLRIFMSIDPRTGTPFAPDAAWYFRCDGQLAGSDRAVLETLVAKVARPGLRIAEIGGATGLGSTRLFGEWARKLDGGVTSIDPWEPLYDVETWNIFERNMAILELEDVVSPLRMTSSEAAAKISDRSCDLVFIDGDHRYDGVRDDIATWRKKVRPGGILCGDDCEGRPQDYDRAELERLKDHDYTEVGLACELSGQVAKAHCGVVLAVADAFGNEYDILGNPPGIWAVEM